MAAFNRKVKGELDLADCMKTRGKLLAGFDKLMRHTRRVLKQTSSSWNKDASIDFFRHWRDFCSDWNDLRSPESLKAVFARSLIIPDHLECISDVQKKCVTDRQMDIASYRDGMI